MSDTIRAGGLAVFDPSDKRVIQFDWDTEALPVGVTITTSVFTIEVIQQAGLTALSKDSESIVAGSRKTSVRLIATTAQAGDSYWVNNKITTNETPAQEIERRFKVLVQN
jgi:hypothetical protein